MAAGIKDFVQEIQKKLGKEIVVNNKQQGIDTVPSGSLSLDIALGGGYPMGRIIELKGYESSGKTTLALTACRNVQKKTGKAIVYIDRENALDMDYVEALGVDTSAERFILTQPGVAEECLEIIREAIKSDSVGAIVMDSVAAMFPRCYLDADVGDAKIGSLANLMSKWIPGFIGDLKKRGILLIFINQYRDKIGVMYGSPKTVPGGKALEFYSSQILDIAKSGTVGDKGEEVANHIRVRVEKNKVAPPLRKAEFDIRFGEGIDKASEILQMASDKGFVEKNGAFYKYKGKVVGQGAENARAALLANEELMAELEDKIISSI